MRRASSLSTAGLLDSNQVDRAAQAVYQLGNACPASDSQCAYQRQDSGRRSAPERQEKGKRGERRRGDRRKEREEKEEDSRRAKCAKDLLQQQRARRSPARILDKAAIGASVVAHWRIASEGQI